MFEEITYNLPFTLYDAEVMDSAVVSPHNSFLKQDIDEYSLTVTFPDDRFVREIEGLFRVNAHPHLEHHREWRFDNYSITATSLIAPRLPKGTTEEFKRGETVQLRVRCELVEGEDKAIERVLIVGFQYAPEAEDIDWTPQPGDHNW